jgi:hypothetical protein
MSAQSKPIATKKAADIQPGDRICYKSGDLLDYSLYPNTYTNLSSEVLCIIDLSDNKIEILTVSGILKVCADTKEFGVISGDYDRAVQTQYDVKPAEVYAGASIE